MIQQDRCPRSHHLPQLIEETLDESVRERLEQHLETCEACQNELDTLVEVDDAAERVIAHLQQPTDVLDQSLLHVMDCIRSRTWESEYPRPIQFDDFVVDYLRPSNQSNSLGCLGSYEISQVIGIGGMGIVMKGCDEKLNRIVAVKVLAPVLALNATARKRFLREAQAAAAISHPSVVTIHSVDEDRLPYLVMEFIDGTSLQERIDAEGFLHLHQILRIGVQVLSGMAAAHAQGIIHRDIKPANILLENGIERAKLTDFGLARAADDASVTREGTVLGTPEYMSPEQARGESVGPASDLFSLGSVLYTLATGRPPFRAESPYAVMRKITDESPKPIRDLNSEMPDWLCAIIGKLMAKEKENRFCSAEEVRGLLEACLSHTQQPSVSPLPQIPDFPIPNSESLVRKTIIGVSLMSLVVMSCLLIVNLLFPLQPDQGGDQPTGLVPAENANAPQDKPQAVVAVRESELTAETQKMLDDLIAETKAKDCPWGDSIQAKQLYWTCELRTAVVDLVGERIQLIESGVQPSAQTMNELRGLADFFNRTIQATESSRNDACEIARKLWPALLLGYPEEMNEVMTKLTKPFVSIRIEDSMAEAGRPTEGIGWEVQAAHALALARVGSIEEAIKQTELLEKKIRLDAQPFLGSPQTPGVQYFGNVRSIGSLLQQVMLQKALIWAIAGEVVASVDASSAAGRVPVINPTKDDQAASQAMLESIHKTLDANRKTRQSSLNE